MDRIPLRLSLTQKAPRGGSSPGLPAKDLDCKSFIRLAAAYATWPVLSEQLCCGTAVSITRLARQKPQIANKNLLDIAICFSFNMSFSKQNFPTNPVLNTMLTEKLHTDFSLRAEGESIEVHKAVLAARSPVLRAMLSHENSKEVQASVLEMEDVEFAVVQQFVDYIYRAKLPSEEPMVKKLLAMAEKYQVNELKTECQNRLVQGLTYGNACFLAVLADFYDCSLLRSKALQLIAESFDDLTSTEGWESFAQKPQLVTDVFVIIFNMRKNGVKQLVTFTIPGSPQFTHTLQNRY
ncbi:unnamed protein product [Caenorhabditis auriculariae]|uniref:BTB domain-containing protein n=1 Tax=Caenorhabditis auriculariae TaxID=2777116 RepID=A0A8S1HSY3_9PELO|nr:unnamed protein product [Caenorhabditis auriculariae]